LHSVGLRGFLPNFLRNFLLDRTFRIKLNDTFSRSYPLAEGIPQGSILSVICFGLAIDGVTSAVPQHIKYSLYVDDLAIYTSSNRINLAIRRTQQAINSLNNWASSKGFSYSHEKTVYMIFRHKSLKTTI
jgi:hypothetical protein